MFSVYYRKVVAAVFIAAFCCVSPAFAAIDMFLKIDGIDAQSEREGGGIPVLAYSHGLSMDTSKIAKSAKGGLSAGKVNFQDFNFTLFSGPWSPQIMLACASGKVIPKVVLEVYRPEQEHKFLVIELQNVLISSYSTGASGGEDRPVENVSMTFLKVKVTFQEHAEAKPVIFQWDLATGKK